MQAQANDIQSTVITLVADQVCADPQTVTPETHLVNDLNFDSLDVVELTMSLEDTFEITIPDEDVEKVLSVGDIIQYVQRRRAAA